MAYSRQDFSSGNVLTAVQADQLEENIASHPHGTSSIVAVPLDAGVRSMLWGRIWARATNPASVVSGISFTVSWAALGAVTITFSKTFVEVPSVMGIIREPNTAIPGGTVNFNTVTFSQALAQCLSASGTAVEREFSFMVIGRGQ